MSTLPAWFTPALACPVESAALVLDGDALACRACNARYPVVGGIPRILSSELLASARAQQRVYDTRNAGASAAAQEAGFALQLIYRRGLLLAALDSMGIPLPSGDALWVYVGGGEGTQCFVLSEHGGHHISLDVSASQLELGKWLAGALVPRYLPRAKADRVAFVQGDAETPFPLRDGSAEVAYGLGVLNHMPPHEWSEHLKRLRNLVVPGGTVFQVIPNLPCEVFRTPIYTSQFANPVSMQYWTQFMTEESVRAAFSAAGLSDITITPAWRLNHDAVSRHTLRFDRAISKALSPLRISWRYHMSRTMQSWASRRLDRLAWLPRSWRFDEPRHLAVGARRPLTAAE